jgi:hypothetical protein
MTSTGYSYTSTPPHSSSISDRTLRPSHLPTSSAQIRQQRTLSFPLNLAQKNLGTVNFSDFIFFKLQTGSITSPTLGMVAYPAIWLGPSGTNYRKLGREIGHTIPWASVRLYGLRVRPLISQMILLSAMKVMRCLLGSALCCVILSTLDRLPSWCGTAISNGVVILGQPREGV